MKKIKEFWNTLPETVSVTKIDGILMLLIALLSGIIAGMLCSPRKNARYGCENGTTTINHWYPDNEEEEFLDEEEEDVQ